MFDEVVDADDVRVLHLGEGEGFGGGGGHRVGVAGVHEALEHHPAVVHVAVDRQVDPAEPAVGDAAAHFVLPADEVAARKPGNKGERCAALGAEALGTPWFSVASAPDGLCCSRSCRRIGDSREPADRSGSPWPGCPSAREAQ